MRKTLLSLPLVAFFACGDPPTPPCDPDAFAPRCDGSSLVLCGGTNEVLIDCGDLTCNVGEQRCGVCGDAEVAGAEECDDGNLNNGDGCSGACFAEVCGNGRLDANEQCDDGNAIGTDGCQGDCTLPSCGDGFIDPGEQCDDGDAENTDGCTTLCRLPDCGDGFLQAPEQCDDANNVNDATCNADCSLPSCGNGVAELNEACDDGNLTNNDGCDNNCTLAACGNAIVNAGEECDDGNQNNEDGCTNQCVGVVVVAQQAPRSSAIALSEDDATLVMTNTDTGTVSIFDTAFRIRVAELVVGETDSEPWAVSISPDATQAFVALRKDGALVEINDINTLTPTVGRTLRVGAESVGLVLSPSGRLAYLTSLVEGAVYVVDTTSFTTKEIILVGANPQGLCMTNDGDADDFDETLFVTQFFGLPSGIVKAGVLPLDSGSEGTDFGRKGVVHAISTADNSLVQNVDLQPLDVTGFAVDLNGDGVNDEQAGAYPNQLGNCTVNNGRVYVPNMAASPRGPVKFNINVQAFVSVFDIATLTEVPGNNIGQRSGTFNINNLVKTQSGNNGGRQFFTNPSDIAFLPGTDVGFAVSTASDYVMPIEWRADGSIALTPAPGTFHIPMAENPIGMVIDSTGTLGYVANRVSRDVKVVDLAAQSVVATVASAAVPAANQPGFNELKGLKFFNTSAVRWSAESWGSCAGCHPNGISDNATWHFAAGPRQTIGLDQTFSKTDPNDQRILNWTGIFDEVHDFNLNTLNVSGAAGTPKPGAIVTDLNADTIEEQVNVTAVDTNGDAVNENHNGLNGGVGLVVDAVSINKGWNQINAYVKTIRPSEASRLLNPVAVARGRTVFTNNKCQNCHGGSKWTISRRSFTPNLGNAAATVSASDARKTTLLSTLALGILNQNTNLVSAETVGFISPYDATLQVVASAATGLQRVACVLRDVGTFGVIDPVTGLRDVRIEVAANMSAQAQGIMGFNPPSLFSLAITAPYLHHGQPQNLEELLSPAFKTHHQAQSANFLATLEDANANNDTQALQDRADLIEFLLSIDTNTTPIAADANQDICPNL